MSALHPLENAGAAVQWLRERTGAGFATSTLQTDSRQVAPGDAFIAWPGAATDGRAHVPAVKVRAEDRGPRVGGGLLRLPHRIPYQKAMELALTGDNLPAADAHQFGLVNRLTEPGGALAAALELAEKIAANGPLAVAATKQVIVQSGDWSGAEAFGKQATLTGHVFGSEDAKEGPRAFAEKRAPVWRGR